MHFAPDHGLGQTFAGCLRNGQLLNHPARAHDRYLVAQTHHFLELVRNQQNGGSLLAQHAQHVEQLLGLLGRQHGGGFVQNQNFGTPVQGFENFQPLPVTHRQISNQRIQGYVQAGRLHQGVELAAHLGIGTL